METLIFYTYEFAASILPFSAAFIFLSHKQKKGGEKTHLLPGLLLFLFAVYIVCVYHVTGTGTLWDAFLYRLNTKQKFPTLILSPFLRESIWSDIL